MAASTILVTAMCVLALPDTISTRKISDWITPCSLKDPQIDQCVTTQSRVLWPHLVEGVEEWGLKPADPLLVPKVELNTGGNRAVNMVITSLNLTFYGLRDLQISGARVDLENFHFEFDIVVPVMSGNNHYKIRGHILLLPISGSGTGNFSYDQFVGKISIDCKPIVQDGKKFLQLTKFHFHANSVKKPRINLDNLFGRKELSDRMNKFMNDNGQAVFSEMKKGIEKALDDILFPVLDGVFKKIPMDELFTDS